MIAVVSLAVGFVFGRTVEMSRQPGLLGLTDPSSVANAPVDLENFWDLWEYVQERYYKTPVEDETLYLGALGGILEALDDPYSDFFTPEEAKEFESELNGTFEGIGMEIGYKEEQLSVVSPLPGTPAERAGLMPGDAIYAIDEVETVGMSVEDAVRRIRGPRGTTVKLLIGREGADGLVELEVEREIIVIESVKFTIRPDGIAYIQVFSFNEDTMGLFTTAVNETLKRNVRGVILDMRGNPGGLLETARAVAGTWLDSQPVLLEDIRGERAPLLGIGTSRLAQIPTVVLVNGGSASASEIVAGALQDYGVARVIGTQTFGKGTVQDYQQWRDGAAVKLTVAEWLTPKGRSIHEVGITPDEVVEVTPEDVEAKRDAQLDAAVDYLNGKTE